MTNKYLLLSLLLILMISNKNFSAEKNNHCIQYYMNDIDITDDLSNINIEPITPVFFNRDSKQDNYEQNDTINNISKDNMQNNLNININIKNLIDFSFKNIIDNDAKQYYIDKRPSKIFNKDNVIQFNNQIKQDKNNPTDISFMRTKFDGTNEIYDNNKQTKKLPLNYNFHINKNEKIKNLRLSLIMNNCNKSNNNDDK